LGETPRSSVVISGCLAQIFSQPRVDRPRTWDGIHPRESDLARQSGLGCQAWLRRGQRGGKLPPLARTWTPSPRLKRGLATSEILTRRLLEPVVDVHPTNLSVKIAQALMFASSPTPRINNGHSPRARACRRGADIVAKVTAENL
jgi:hypothetical protein